MRTAHKSTGTHAATGRRYAAGLRHLINRGTLGVQVLTWFITVSALSQYCQGSLWAST